MKSLYEWLQEVGDTTWYEMFDEITADTAENYNLEEPEVWEPYFVKQQEKLAQERLGNNIIKSKEWQEYKERWINYYN